VTISIAALAFLYLIVMGFQVGFFKTITIAIAASFVGIVATLAGITTDILAALQSAATAISG
jgi:hypothetical protein